MRRFQKENSFSKIEKKIQVDSTMEFPSLFDVIPALQNENKEKKNYVDMLIENNEEKKDVYLPSWLHISMDKNRKIKKIFNGKEYETPKNRGEQDIELLNNAEYNKKAVKVISEMVQNWENYKTWYISLYGTDCYDRMYEMVYKEDEIFYSGDDERDEDDNLNQDNIYTDEDDDYY